MKDYIFILESLNHRAIYNSLINPCAVCAVMMLVEVVVTAVNISQLLSIYLYIVFPVL